MLCPTSRPCVMPSLNSLPMSILTKIMHHLVDDDVSEIRSSLQGTTSFLPFHYPYLDYTLDNADAAHATIPSRLLAPALSSPVLAAAVRNLIHGRLSYLTFLNTEGRLPIWIHAFARYVKAVAAGFVAEEWHDGLPNNLRALRLKQVVRNTVDAFKAITLNHVRLRVLDLVHVPFDECGSMEDDMMAGLCATLESVRTTLRELALPVYSDSDLCACALETATLPYLEVFSVELMNVRNPKNVSDRRRQCLGRPFLRMMQAIEGHADKSKGLTTLAELRLINLYVVPCTAVRESGCGAGLFRAVRTLRAAMNESIKYASTEELSFFSLFRKLECLYWNGMPNKSHTAFGKLCRKLDEVHLCHRRWITGAQVGAQSFEPLVSGHSLHVQDSIQMGFRKIMTLVTYNYLDATDVLHISRYCPNLKYLSLHVTQEVLHELRRLIKECELLTGLEIIVDEYLMGRLGKEGWLELGKAIPRYHANLCDVAIETRYKYQKISAPLDAVIGCFVDVVKRLGIYAERLVFRASVRSRNIVQVINGLSRILHTCAFRALRLMCLKIDIIPLPAWKGYDMNALLDAQWNLRYTKSFTLRCCHRLGKVDLGYLHRFSNRLDLSGG